MVWIIAVWFIINNIPFFVAIFEFSLSEPFNEFTVFWVSIIYIIVAEFCEKLKVVSSDFSIIKNIVAPLSLSRFPIKLICCGSFNLVYLLKSIAITSCIVIIIAYIYNFLVSFFFIFYWKAKKNSPSIKTLKSVISTFGT